MLPTRTVGRLGGPQYERHQPGKTLLYQIIAQHYPVFKESLEAQGRSLPNYVQREFEEFLTCGRLEHGFLRVRCEDCKHERLVAFSCKRRGFCPSCGARRMAETAALLVDEVFPREPMRQWVLSFPFQLRFLFASDPELMGKVLGIVYRALSTHLIKNGGFSKAAARTGAVTLIQRFGSALNLNVHFHMLFLDGVYTEDAKGKMCFHRVKAPTQEELLHLAHTLSHRVARFLERRGLLERDAENSYLVFEQQEEEVMQQLFGHSITYRIAMGPHQGRKVFTLQTLPPLPENGKPGQAAKMAGFSLHAGVVAEPHRRDKLERLCRYISRPAVSEQRLALTANGKIRYQLKTPYHDGTTHVIFEPLDFIARLAAFVPKPRVNLTRFHGVFAPNSKQRVRITPAKRGKGRGQAKFEASSWLEKMPEERHRAMAWMQRLKRVFNIDIETCERCGGKVKVIASIEDPAVIAHILKHLKQKGVLKTGIQPHELPQERAPPVMRLLD